MSVHVHNVCKSAYIQLRQISSIRHLLNTQATQILITTLVLSRLDYCNSLLSGCPKHLIEKLQRVQNASARLVCKVAKSHDVQPLLKSLRWLPVACRVQYKLSTICFNLVLGTGPKYPSDLLQTYTPSRHLRSSIDTRLFRKQRIVTKNLW